MKRLVPFLAAATFAAAAVAQQPAAPAAQPPSAPAAHGCKSPGEHPGRLASDLQRRNWVKDANAYLACVRKFIDEQQAAYKALADKAMPHLQAANSAIEEYNKAFEAFKAQQDN